MNLVAWSDAAIADLHEIRRYLEETFGSGASRATIEALILSTYWLLEHPHAGPRLDHPRWRKWKPRRTRHVLIYEPTSSGIAIVRVRHEANDWRPLPE